MIGAVKAMLKENPVGEGEAAVLVIEAIGSDIVFPDIEEIGGQTVQTRATSRNITSINGKVKKTLTRSYQFQPQKEMMIPAFDVWIDGQKEMTEPFALKIKKDIENGKKAFIFTQEIDKDEVYVGEPILLTYTFKQRLDVDLSEANFNAPSFQSFWAKSTRKVPNKIEGDYNIYQINYLLYPQQSGDLKIESGRMDAAVMSSQKRDFFSFQQVKWKAIYSNVLEVKVKDLPAGVQLYGDYSFTVVADKNITKTNEPVNLTITIRGEGNVDDIDDFDIVVPNATVYADKSKKSANLTDGKNTILFKQKFAIVSDRNFTIPAQTFSFFNGEVQELHSRSFDIEVINAKSVKREGILEKKVVERSVGQENVTVQGYSTISIMIAALLGFLAGLAVMWVFMNKKKRERKHDDEPLVKRIKEAKEDKALLALLLPYMDRSADMQALIRTLEANVYEGKETYIDRKKLARELESYMREKKEDTILKDV